MADRRRATTTYTAWGRERKSRKDFLKLFGSTVAASGLGLVGFNLFGTEEAGEDRLVSSVRKPTSSGAPEAVESTEQKDKEPKEQQPSSADNSQSSQQRDPDPAPPNNTMSLTVPRLGIYNNVVRNSNSTWALDQGAAKLPRTGFPWESGDTNTYIAGHRIGYPGTESYYQFFDLPAMKRGDRVYLTDSAGRNYDYRVTKVFAVRPQDTWVTGPVSGKDVVSLQTCVETVNRSDWWDITPKLLEAGPDTGRLIARAERVN